MPDAEPSASLHLRPYCTADQSAFQALNEEWIRAFFRLEPHDREQLSDPEAHILSGGGAIVMAERDGAPVGCFALVAIGPRAYELAKMAITPALRGRGQGRKLMEAALAEARSRGAQRLYLETNSRLLSAIHLYEAYGFRHLAAEQRQPTPYERADVAMELLLD